MILSPGAGFLPTAPACVCLVLAPQRAKAHPQVLGVESQGSKERAQETERSSQEMPQPCPGRRSPTLEGELCGMALWFCTLDCRPKHLRSY